MTVCIINNLLYYIMIVLRAVYVGLCIVPIIKYFLLLFAIENRYNNNNNNGGRIS